jgi:hypothetical protein
MNAATRHGQSRADIVERHGEIAGGLRVFLAQQWIDAIGRIEGRRVGPRKAHQLAQQ